jgi:hypothetical protein
MLLQRLPLLLFDFDVDVPGLDNFSFALGTPSPVNHDNRGNDQKKCAIYRSCSLQPGHGETGALLGFVGL